MRIFKFLLVLSVLGVAGLFPVPKAAASSRVDTYITNVDTYVDSSNPTTYHNSTTPLRIGYNATSGQKERALINIPASFVSGMTVHTASFNLYMTACSASTVTVAIMRATSDWNGYTTWNNQPSFNGMMTLSSPCNVNRWSNFYIEDIVREWVNGTPNYGLVINGIESGSTTWWREFSSEDGSYAPRLVVGYDYTPTLPIASSVSVSNISKTGATITWNTNISCSSPVALNTVSNPYYDWDGANDRGTSHTVLITGLSPGTQYSFRFPYYEQIEEATYYYTNWQTFTTASDALPGSTTADPSTGPATIAANTTTSATASAKEAVKTVDASIPAPTFDYALKNEEQIMPAENLSIEMIKTDTLNVVGKSFPSAKLVLTAEDKAFTATANAEGVWQITFSGNDLDNGRYNIKIQAQDEQKQLGSEEVALFSLLVGENSEDLSALRQEQKNNILNWINSRPLWLRLLLALGALSVLAALAVGIHFLVRKIRKRRIIKKSSETPPQQVK